MVYIVEASQTMSIYSVLVKWTRGKNKHEFDSAASIVLANELLCLFLSSLKDPFVLSDRMTALSSCCEGAKKSIMQFDGCNHSSNKLLPVYWDCMEDFVSRVLSE